MLLVSAIVSGQRRPAATKGEAPRCGRPAPADKVSPLRYTALLRESPGMYGITRRMRFTELTASYGLHFS
jgi:hypothetical protein